MEFNNFLTRLSASAQYLEETTNDSRNISIELHQELLNLYRNQLDYIALVTDLTLRDSRLGLAAPSSLSVQNQYETVTTLAESPCKNLGNGLAMRKPELLKMYEFMELVKAEAFETRIREDPVGVETEMNQAVTKINEIKIHLESLKVEWNTVKDRLNDGIDSCIQQINLLLHERIVQEQGPDEE